MRNVLSFVIALALCGCGDMATESPAPVNIADAADDSDSGQVCTISHSINGPRVELRVRHSGRIDEVIFDDGELIEDRGMIASGAVIERRVDVWCSVGDLERSALDCLIALWQAGVCWHA